MEGTTVAAAVFEPTHWVPERDPPLGQEYAMVVVSTAVTV
jgi:hypothetical protein